MNNFTINFIINIGIISSLLTLAMIVDTNISYIIIYLGGIIAMAAASFLFSWMKNYFRSGNQDDLLCVKGLSPTSIKIVIETIERRRIWEEHRGQNKYLFRRIHAD